MFKPLAGNANVRAALGRMARTGRIPHSLILAGDEGVGKRAFALEAARSLVCLDPGEGDACGACSSCKRAATFVLPKPEDRDDHKRVIFSNHPDVGTVIPYNRNILVDAIRHLETEANFRPYEAKARIFIIDDADKMNDSASNALLKTLEEPPATTYLFLVTSRPDSLLQTIRSRCQMLRFSPIDTSEIEQYLISDRAFSHDEARFAAALSRGSIGRALKLNVDHTKQIREKLLAAIGNALTTGDRAQLLRTAEEINDVKNKDQFEDSLDLLQSLIHDVWKLNVGGDSAKIVNVDLAQELNRLAAAAGNADMPAWLRSIDELRENLGININRKIAADALLVGMAGV